MAEEQEKPKEKALSVRERAERAIAEANKAAKHAKTEGVIEAKVEVEAKPKRRLLRRKKAVDPNKPLKNRRFHIIPKFIRNSFSELKKVTWPNRRDTFKLTSAVIIFSIVFSAVISLVDYGFGIIFKRVFLHG